MSVVPKLRNPGLGRQCGNSCQDATEGRRWKQRAQGSHSFRETEVRPFLAGWRQDEQEMANPLSSRQILQEKKDAICNSSYRQFSTKCGKTKFKTFFLLNHLRASYFMIKKLVNDIQLQENCHHEGIGHRALTVAVTFSFFF